VVTDLDAVLLEDTRVLLARWRRRFAGRPGAERERLLLLALEREQIVAVAYREEAVAGRVAALEVGAAARALIRQTLMWIWKDEQLHFEFMRGLLLESGSAASSLVVYGRQVQGMLSGWTSSTATGLQARSAPMRTGAAGALIAVARGLHQMPAAAVVRAGSVMATWLVRGGAAGMPRGRRGNGASGRSGPGRPRRPAGTRTRRLR
jgi:hypothetical protein